MTVSRIFCAVSGDIAVDSKNSPSAGFHIAEPVITMNGRFALTSFMRLSTVEGVLAVAIVNKAPFPIASFKIWAERRETRLSEDNNVPSRSVTKRVFPILFALRLDLFPLGVADLTFMPFSLVAV